MQPRIHVITLAVNDLEGALVFYRDGCAPRPPLGYLLGLFP
jgi:hypothetical protein